MFFGSFSAVFVSFSNRFRLVSKCFRAVLHGFHTVFFVCLASSSSSSRRRFRRRRRLRCRRGDPSPVVVVGAFETHGRASPCFEKMLEAYRGWLSTSDLDILDFSVIV